MEITYLIIVAIITYIAGSITSLFVDGVPDKYIPIQNVIIGLVSGFACYFAGIETVLLNSLVLCFMAAVAAGGTYDALTITKNSTEE